MESNEIKDNDTSGRISQITQQMPKELPDIINRIISGLICPITQQIIEKPVVASDGHIYEKSALEALLKRKSSELRSPVTREKISGAMYRCHLIECVINIISKNFPEHKEKFVPTKL